MQTANPDQTAPSGSTVFAMLFWKQLHKWQNLGQKVWNKVFEIL